MFGVQLATASGRAPAFPELDQDHQRDQPQADGIGDGKNGWGMDAMGIMQSGDSWYYNEAVDHLLYRKIDTYNYYVFDKNKKFMYYVQFST